VDEKLHAAFAAIRNHELLMPLEKLHGALVLRRRGAAPKGAEIAPPAGLRIFLAGIEPVFAGGELADHDGFLNDRSKNSSVQIARAEIGSGKALPMAGLVPAISITMAQHCPSKPSLGMTIRNSQRRTRFKDIGRARCRMESPEKPS
jgi:hypothetical protein